VPVIELSALESRAPDGRILFQTQGCRFPSNEFTIIAGQNGSGKSVLVRLLAGLLRPSSGSVRLDDRPLRRPRDFRQAGITLCPQDPASQLIGRTVGEELAIGLSPGESVDPHLEWAELGNLIESDPRCLSWGEQRRLSLAVALADQARFLILDDPFLGLDQTFVPGLIKRLLDWHSSGHGIILVTNELEKILAHANRLILLKQGRIIADALPERVLPYLDAHGFRKPTQKLAEMTWIKP
jgi:biotin transport system ATP-binding protein